MFIITSNTGDWDSDFVGVVGSIVDTCDFLAVVKKMGEYSDEEMSNGRYITDNEERNKFFDDNELNEIVDCEGVLTYTFVVGKYDDIFECLQLTPYES